MWKKLLTPTLIFTLVILFALTWYVSIKAEEYFSQWVERSNQVAPPITSTDLVSYNRGFFTAEAITTVDIKDIGHYDFHHLIRHYVWGVTIITTPVAATDSTSLLDGLRIVTDVGPTGAARSRMSMPQLAFESDLGQTLVVDRIAAEGRVNATATEGSWDLTLDQLRLVVDEHSSILISGFHSSADMTNLDHFPLGHNRTRINSISLEKTAGRPLVVEGLNMLGNNLFDASRHYLARSEISFARLKANDNIFQNGRMVLELRDIDAQVIEVFVAAGNNLRSRINTATVTGDDVTDLFILPLTNTLLASGLTLSLEELSLATTDGHLRGEGKAILAAGPTDITLEELLEQIHISLQADFDVQILAHINQLFSGTVGNLAAKEEEFRMIFGGLAQLGFLSRLEGDRFRLLVSYDDGEIKLNGQPFQLF